MSLEVPPAGRSGAMTDLRSAEASGEPQTATHSRHAVRAGLGTIVAASAAPYGYTLAIWSSGAVLIDAHGKPSVAEVFLFLAGAVCAFAALGLLAQGPLAIPKSIDKRRERIIAGALDLLAVGAAVGAVALLAQIGGWIAWPLGSFAATVTYLVGAGLQLALAAGSDEPPEEG
jgi:hypothetical protein